MTNQIKIVSYFSEPTDLAGELRNWKEFVSGAGYTVMLTNSDTGEIVTIRYVESENEPDYVEINSNSGNELFDRAAGRVIRALAMNSDNLMVYK